MAGSSGRAGAWYSVLWARTRNTRCELQVSLRASPCLSVGAAVFFQVESGLCYLPSWISRWRIQQSLGRAGGVSIGRCQAALADVVPSRKGPHTHILSKCAFSFLNCVHALSPRLRTRGAGRGKCSHSSGTQSLGHLSWADQHPSLGPVRDLLSGLPSSCLLRRPLPGPAPGSGYLGAQPTHGKGPMCHLPVHW